MEEKEMNQQVFRFSDPKEQVKRSNQAMMIGYDIFYFCMVVISLIAYFSGKRSLLVTIIACVLSIGSLCGAGIFFMRRKDSVSMRYFSMVGLLLVSFFIGLIFDSTYVRYMTIIPIAGTVIYMDSKYTRIATASFCVLNIALTAYKVMSGMYVGDEAASVMCDTFVIVFILVTMLAVERVLKMFMDHAMADLRQKQENQYAIMEDVLQVAANVRRGTENAMEIVNSLNESTGSVSESIQDISASSLHTAENIQTQTVMTQNIQQAIDETLQRSENMVKAAKESEELNHKGVELMETLKQQSEIISDTNTNLATSMKELQERTLMVKSIASTIFAISSQTNLLALNASIESARAGEAGKGFAVVADEIRQLAEKTRKETENIASILDGLSQNAETAVIAVGESVEATNQQEEMINQVSDSFKGINENVNNLTGDISEIDRMLVQLSESNNQIVENILQLSAATEEVTASSTQVAELSVQNLENADETKNLLSGVLEVSHKLDKYQDL